MHLSATDLHLSQSLKYAGSLMRQNCMVRGVQVFLSVHSMDSYAYLSQRLIRAWYPILRIHGIPEDRLELWTKRADEGL
jgi:hypothetical protein